MLWSRIVILFLHACLFCYLHRTQLANQNTKKNYENSVFAFHFVRDNRLYDWSSFLVLVNQGRSKPWETRGVKKQQVTTTKKNSPGPSPCYGPVNRRTNVLTVTLVRNSPCSVMNGCMLWCHFRFWLICILQLPQGCEFTCRMKIGQSVWVDRQ